MSSQAKLFDALIAGQKKAYGNIANVDVFFGLFATEQILKDTSLTLADLEESDVDGSNDGGLDYIITLFNGELYSDPEDAKDVTGSCVVDIYLIQTKNEAKFKESALLQIKSTCGDIFDFDRPLDTFKKKYNEEVLAKARLFRSAIERAIKKPHSSIRIGIFYASKGDISNLSAKQQHLVSDIQTSVRKLTSGEVTCKCLGASDLIEAFRTPVQETLELKFSELTSAESLVAPDSQAFLGLANLADYCQFVTASDGSQRSEMFDDNVRDFFRDVRVNSSIKDTILNKKTQEFWWLNNGITILASKIKPIGKKLQLTSPLIVNGLQTTRVLFNALKDTNAESEKRKIQIRAIEVDEDDTALRDNIIRATNSQTPISPSQLHATEKVQRDIEQYLFSHNVYYDRRKHYYRNLGKPRRRIVSILQLGQTLMAVILRKPTTARARPNALLDDKTTYEKLFNEELDPDIYLKAAELFICMEEMFGQTGVEYEKSEKKNVKFHLLVLMACGLAGKPHVSATALASIKISKMTQQMFDQLLAKILTLFRSMGGTDQVSKGNEFEPAVLKLVLPKKPSAKVALKK